MPTKKSSDGKEALFPILKGTNVGRNGMTTGQVVIATKPDQLGRQWGSNEIAVLALDLSTHFRNCPGDVDRLFSRVGAVLAEFGSPISEFAACGYARGAIAVVKVDDATEVLENGMGIRVVAREGLAEVFFLD
ncbi:MAG: hypothetical protein R6V83_08920 [Candidatus Thorarchaeota archaeon]